MNESGGSAYTLKYDSLHRLQGRNQELSEDDAGDDFAGTDSEHHEGNHVRHTVGKPQDKRNNERVCNHRRPGTKEAMFAQHVSPKGADQSCNRSEDNIRQCGAGDEIGEQTTGKKPRHRRRRKKRQDGQSFRKPTLNHPAGEVKSPGENRKSDVERCNHGCLCNE